MRTTTTLLALCATLSLTPTLHAQTIGGRTIQTIWPSADCRITEREWDGYWAPRYVFYTVDATLTLAVHAVALNVVHLPPWPAAVASTLGVGLAPHVLGVLDHSYPLSPRDWAAHLALSTTPLVWEAIQHSRGARRMIAPAGYAVGDAITRCWNMP